MITSRKVRWAGQVIRTEATKNECSILMGTQEGKKPLGRPRNGKDHNVDTCMAVRETARGVIGWIYLVWNRVQWQALVKNVMNLRINS